MSGALLLAGTSAGEGTTMLVAGLCRWLRKQGVTVAPFRPLGTALSSYVTADGAEIGRAQAMQAEAAGIEPDARMNPVLLRPGIDCWQVLVLGHEVGQVDASDFAENAGRLLDVAVDNLTALRQEFDVVICEGASGPPELRPRGLGLPDLDLSRAAGLATLLAADAGTDGWLAALYGTLALLPPEDQALVSGFLLTTAGASSAPGWEQETGLLRGLTGRPILGGLPHCAAAWLATEHGNGGDAWPHPPSAPRLGHDILRVSVISLPRMSSVADIDPLAAEPGVLVRLADRAEDLADADLVIVPGSRATVADLAYIRERGMAELIASRSRSGRPVLGIGGGYQMLTEELADDVESGAGTVSGLGLLPASVAFGESATVGRRSGSAYGAEVAGFEAGRGAVTPAGIRAEPFPGGCRSGVVWGTSWHGVLENDAFRRAFLTEVAALAGRDFKPAPDTSYAALRLAALDRIGDLAEAGLDAAAILRLVEGGPPPGLPVVPPAGGRAGSPPSR